MLALSLSLNLSLSLSCALYTYLYLSLSLYLSFHPYIYIYIYSFFLTCFSLPLCLSLSVASTTILDQEGPPSLQKSELLGIGADPDTLHLVNARGQPSESIVDSMVCSFIHKIGHGRNTVSRVLFRRRELTEPH